ncbi:ArnT family glycosyltransferase [Kutzneria kofuensis]|uniref:4-amino-4-deoxy-L-arabinose transferase-like glycosyltransferase n=1 Tax=Kutzneria kofuensis TaxID=103725 RepID=A0A7W9NKD5_9PSEU|nr:glycosyltransferase family 39 protein [Kutzneria kofuensis]MBB5895910.1 4-amino-4-deoxy-L-arabinose transferase-like glycosyltransferase [Kutzneria kofuensis]
MHNYYASAVRSMAGSWRAFLFGGFDPQGSISIDKIPGAFWVQALSVRAFGFHDWSVALPSVLEAVLTILVLYKVVKRWAGEAAGLLAALVMALTPIAAALAKSQISDTLLTLLLVLAAGAWQRSVLDDKPLWPCAVWIGLAFHVKMVQAWLVLPVFAIGYLLFAQRRRIWRLAAAGGVTLAVSSVWVVITLLTPAADRPYIDATADNDPLSMVLGYNAARRFHGGHGWRDLLSEHTFLQVGWMYPICLLAIVLGLLWTRRRSGFAMWGMWMAVHFAAFGFGQFRHAYYVVVLAPAAAALTGAGLVLFWRERSRQPWLLPTVVMVTAGWTLLLPHRSLTAAVAILALLAVLALLAARTSRSAALGAVIGLVAVLITPAAWTLSTDSYVARANAANPSADAKPRKPHLLSKEDRELLDFVRRGSGNARYVLAVDGAGPAATLISQAGASVLPMGGYSAKTPFPTAEQFRSLIHTGQLRYVQGKVTKPAKTVPQANVDWAAEHCEEVRAHLYDCAGK